MEIVAKAHYPNHLHQGNGVKLQFGKTGILRTEKKKEIAVLEKYNGLNGRWSIVDRIYTPEEQKKIDVKIKKENDAKTATARLLVETQIADEKIRLELRIKALELGVPNPMQMTINELHRVIAQKSAEVAEAKKLVEEKEEADGLNKKKKNI